MSHFKAKMHQFRFQVYVRFFLSVFPILSVCGLCLSVTLFYYMILLTSIIFSVVYINGVQNEKNTNFVNFRK